MDISDWRKKIDEVDAAVLKLVNLRADMAIEIGKLKSQEGIGLRTPTREREIVERMQQANPGPLDAESIERIYETIVNQCIRAQERSQSETSEQTARDGSGRAVGPGERDVKTKAANAGKRRKSRKARK
jgi:chorismate mutase-like protein